MRYSSAAFHTATGPTRTFNVWADGPVTNVTVGQTFGVGAGNSRFAVRPVGEWAEPVVSATGAYVRADTDARMPAVGVPIEFTRAYTSADATSGPLGPGWTHTYNVSVSFDASGHPTVRADDGQQLHFTKQPDNSYVPDPGGRATFAAIAGGYRLTYHDFVADTFDTAGRLVSRLDRHGKGLTFTHDATTGRLTSVSGSGRTLTLAYDPTTTLLTSITLPDGRHADYAYTSGRLTSVTDMAGGVTTYDYDAGGRLNKITDPRNLDIVRNTYDASTGRITDQWDGRNNHSTFAWNAATETATMTDARNNVWTDDYENGALVRRSDPLGNTTRFSWDDNLNLRRITDPRGLTWSMTYDARGNLAGRGSPVSTLSGETFGYSAWNDVNNAGHPRGNYTLYNYDANGYLTSIQHPIAGITSATFAYDPTTTLVSSVTDARNKTTTFGYNAAGDRTRVTSPLNEATTFGYDSTGRLTSKVSPKGNVTGANPADYTTTFTYDGTDHLRTTTDPLGNVVEQTYNAAGLLASVIDPNLRTTSFGYDADAHLTTVTAPGSVTTTYDYDATGNLSSRLDAKNHTTTFGYNAANRLTSVASPLRTLTYGYDAAGNRTTVTNGRNVTETTGYDGLNRPASIIYSDGTPAVSFGYDHNGNRTSMSDGTGSTSYTYDWQDRLTRANGPTGIFDYTYDGDNNVLTRKYPDNTTFTYTYDDDGRMATVANGSTTMATFGYDVNSNPTTTAYQATNGYTETRSFDRADRMTEVSTANVAGNFVRSAATLDPAGNPLQVVDEAGATTTHEYDTRNRLSKVCFATATCTGATDFISYTYDAVGNRLNETRPTSGASTTYTYDATDKLTSSVTGNKTTNYTYDADGNQLSGGGTFTYDGASRLKTAKIGNVTTTYTYEGDGLRHEGSTGSNASSKTRFVWDKNVASGLPALALERDGNNATRRLYTYGLGSTPLAETVVGLPYYFHQDRLGSVRGVTSNTGVGQWRYAYEPYGKAKTTTKLVTSAPVNPVQFTGAYLDSGTFYNLRARELDVNNGRFLQSDPVMEGVHDPYVASYVYAHNRPTVFTDPTGACLFCMDTLKTAATVAGAGALAATVVLAAPVALPAGAVATASLAQGVLGASAVAYGAAYAAGTCAAEGLSVECGVAAGSVAAGVGERALAPVAGRIVRGALIAGKNGDDVLVLRRVGDNLTGAIVGTVNTAVLVGSDRQWRASRK